MPDKKYDFSAFDEKIPEVSNEDTGTIPKETTAEYDFSAFDEGIPEENDEVVVEKLLGQIKDQEAKTGVVELTPTLRKEADFINRQAAEKKALMKASRDKINSEYGKDAWISDVSIDSPEAKEVFESIKEEAVDSISQPFRFDNLTAKVKSISDKVTDEKAKTLVFEEYHNYVYDKVFNTKERRLWDAKKSRDDIKEKYEKDPENHSLLVSLKTADDALAELRGDDFKPLLDENGDFVDKEYAEMSQEDINDISVKSKVYDTWSPKKLYDIFTDLTAKNMALDKEIKKVGAGFEIKLSKNPLGEMAYDRGNDEISKKISRIKQIKLPIYKELKAVSHSLMLNHDMSSIKSNWFHMVGRGILSGIDDAAAPFSGAQGKMAVTETEMQELYNQAILKQGGKITEAQKEEAIRTVWDQTGLAVGNSIPIALEMMASGAVIGTASKALSLAKYADKLVALSRLKAGRTGAAWAKAVVNIGKAEGYGALQYGLIPGDNISAAMGVGEKAGERLSNFIFKGKNVGRIGEYLVRVLTGTGAETISEFAGDFADSMSKNGFDLDKSLGDTFGRTGDEIIDKFLVTAATCAVFSGSYNAPALLKIRKAIELEPDSPAKEKGLEHMDEIIGDSQKTKTQGADASQSELGTILNKTMGPLISGLSLSTTTDNAIRDIEQGTDVSENNSFVALNETKEMLDIMNERTPEEIGFTEEQYNNTVAALESSIEKVEGNLLKIKAIEAENHYRKNGEEITKEEAEKIVSEAKDVSELKGLDIRDSELETKMRDKFQDNVEETEKKPEDKKVAEPEYKINDAPVTKDEVVAAIEKAKDVSEIQNVKFSNDPELDNMVNAKFGESTTEVSAENTNQSEDSTESDIEKGITVNLDNNNTENTEGVNPDSTTEATAESTTEVTEKGKAKSVSLASKAVSGLKGMTLTNDNVADFEKRINEVKGRLTGLSLAGIDTGRLMTKVVNISKRLQDAKKRGSVERQKGQKYSVEDLTKMFLEDYNKIVGKAEVKLKESARAKAESYISSAVKKSRKTKPNGERVGKISDLVAETLSYLSNALSRSKQKATILNRTQALYAKISESSKVLSDITAEIKTSLDADVISGLKKKRAEVIATRDAHIQALEKLHGDLDAIDSKYKTMTVDEAVEVIQDGDANDFQLAQADAVLFGSNLIEGHENWSAEEWNEFEKKVKEDVKAGRSQISQEIQKVRENNKKIKEEVDADVDMKKVPTDMSSKSELKEKKEGFVRPEEAHTAFSRKLISILRRPGVTLEKIRNTLFSESIKWSSHAATIASLFDKNEKSAYDGNLHKRLITPIIKAYSQMNRGIIDSQTKIYSGLVEMIAPDKIKQIRDTKGSVRFKAKKIREIFDGWVNERILRSDKLKISIDVDGKEQTFFRSPNDAMMLYAWSLDPKVWEEMSLRNGFTPEKMQEIKDFLGSDVTDFVDYVVKDFMSDSYKRLNSAHKEINFANLSYVENYFPLLRSTLGDPTEIKGENDMVHALNQSISSIKERTKNNRSIDYAADNGFLQTLFGHIDETERYIAYAKPTRDVNAALRSKNLNLALDHYGLKQVFKSLLEKGAGKSNRKWVGMKGLKKLYHTYMVGALAGRIIQYPKQASSFGEMLPEYIELKGGYKAVPKFFADAAYKFANPMALYNDAMMLYEKSPTFRHRWDSEMVSIDMVEGSNRKPWRSLTAPQKFGAGLNAFTKYGDLIGITLGASQIYKAAIEVGKTEAEAIELVENYESTQQAKNPIYHNMPQQSDDIFKDMFTAFRSTPILMLNKSIASGNSIIRAIKRDGWKKASIRKDVNTLIMNWAVTNVLYTAIGTLPTLLRGDEDDYWKGIAQSAVVGPMSGFIVFGEYAEWMYKIASEAWKDGYVKKIDRVDSAIPILQTFEDVAKPWVGKNVDPGEAAVMSAFYLLQFKGLPAETSQNVYKGAEGIFEDGWNVEDMERMLGWTENQVTGGKTKGKPRLPSF